MRLYQIKTGSSSFSSRFILARTVELALNAYLYQESGAGVRGGPDGRKQIYSDDEVADKRRRAMDNITSITLIDSGAVMATPDGQAVGG